jgi:hypothetical protein
MVHTALMEWAGIELVDRIDDEPGEMVLRDPLLDAHGEGEQELISIGGQVLTGHVETYGIAVPPYATIKLRNYHYIPVRRCDIY